MTKAELKSALERHPTPWATRPCFAKDCWCLIIVDANDKGDDSLETCVVAAGCLAADAAELIVAAVNERHGPA